MFSVSSDIESEGRYRRYQLFDGVEPLSYATVLELWRGSYTFRDWFTRLLTDSPSTVFRWETPPVTVATVGRPFEFVLVDAPEIDVPPDSSPFADYFARSSGTVIAFENLGRDAIMVVPVPRGDQSAYPHLAAFLRNGPPEQIDQLWQTVGNVVSHRLSEAPLWLSTAGGGVAWLHVRLDSSPKYYSYAQYRDPEVEI